MDTYQQFQEKRKKQKKKALETLNGFKEKKLDLKRPVFFVPGWTDENCKWWVENGVVDKGIKWWVENIFNNPQDAHYITFADCSEKCRSFLDFGIFLRDKVWTIVGKDQEFDIIGHSMGGLDIRVYVFKQNETIGRLN